MADRHECCFNASQPLDPGVRVEEVKNHIFSFQDESMSQNLLCSHDRVPDLPERDAF